MLSTASTAWQSHPRSTDFFVHRSQICETFPFISFYLFFPLIFSFKKTPNIKTTLEQGWYRVNTHCQWHWRTLGNFSVPWILYLEEVTASVSLSLSVTSGGMCTPCHLCTGVQYSSCQPEKVSLTFSTTSHWLLAACAVCHFFNKDLFFFRPIYQCNRKHQLLLID